MTGTVKGNELTINFKVSAQGADLAITYVGTVEGDTIKGKGVSFTQSYGASGDQSRAVASGLPADLGVGARAEPPGQAEQGDGGLAVGRGATRAPDIIP